MRTTKTLAVLASLTLVVAACGNGETEPTDEVAETVTGTQVTETTVADHDDHDDDDHDDHDDDDGDDDDTAGGQEGGTVVLFNGTDVSADFGPGRCGMGDDDGVPHVEYDANLAQGDGELEIEVDLTDPPYLDEFTIDLPDGTEWEADDAQEAAATVTVTGNEYHVDTEVHEDDNGQTARVEVTFTCPA